MKIQANELRIGNFINQKLIKGKYRDTPINVVKVCGTFISGVDRYNKEFSESYEPIPITEEWLLKLGFVNDDDQRYFKNGIYLILYDEGCTILHNQIHINYFYVHQLQNLYFAITGKELTYGNNPD